MSKKYLLEPELGKSSYDEELYCKDIDGQEVYINIIEAKEPKLFTSVKKYEANDKKDLGKVEYFKKIVKPTMEESSKHKIFLKKEVKKNFFY